MVLITDLVVLQLIQMNSLQIKMAIKSIHNINLSPLQNQIILGELGKYVSERMSIDQYYLIETIYLLLGEVDEQEMKTNYPDYDKVIKKVERFNKIVQKSKTFYDLVQDKTFKTKFKDMDSFQKYVKTQLKKVSSKIPLIQLDVYKLFVYLVNNSTIQGYTIRPDMLKVLEYRDNTRIDMSKKGKDTSSSGNKN